MITRQQALAASSPFLAVVVGEVVIGGLIIVGWNAWERRRQLLEIGRRTVRL